MSFNYGQQTTRKVLDLNPTYWWTLNNSKISTVSLTGSTVDSVVSGGSSTTTVTGTNWTSTVVNGKRWGYGSAANGRLYNGSLPVAIGYLTSAFCIVRIKQYAYSAWPYFYDAQSPRVSFSIDSFGADIGGGEMSIHSGQTYGYDSGDTTIGGRINSSTYTICGVYAHYDSTNSFMSWTDAVTNTINADLINNIPPATASTNTDTEIYINNRNSIDRGTINVQMAEVIMFPQKDLSTDERNILWDYLHEYYYMNTATAP
jgi:hypothetical protein